MQIQQISVTQLHIDRAILSPDPKITPYGLALEDAGLRCQVTEQCIFIALRNDPLKMPGFQSWCVAPIARPLRSAMTRWKYHETIEPFTFDLENDDAN